MLAWEGPWGLHMMYVSASTESSFILEDRGQDFQSTELLHTNATNCKWPRDDFL